MDLVEVGETTFLVYDLTIQNMAHDSMHGIKSWLIFKIL